MYMFIYIYKYMDDVYADMDIYTYICICIIHISYIVKYIGRYDQYAPGRVEHGTSDDKLKAFRLISHNVFLN